MAAPVVHPLLVPAILAAGGAVVAYEVIGHVFGSKAASKRIAPGKAPPRKLTPGTSPGPPTTAPANQIQSPSTSFTPTPSGALKSPSRGLSSPSPSPSPAPPPDDDNPPPDDSGGGSDDGSVPTLGTVYDEDGDPGGLGAGVTGAGTDEGTGQGPGSSLSGSSGASSGDMDASDASGGSDESDDVDTAAASFASSSAGKAAADLLSSGGDEDALSSLLAVAGPFRKYARRRRGRVGASEHMNNEMQWIDFQWVTLQPSSVHSAELPPPPHVHMSSGKWIRYDGGIAHGRPSEDPRSGVYGRQVFGPDQGPGWYAKGRGGTNLPLSALEVNFVAYPGVPAGMTLFAWRPNDHTTDKINGYWAYGLGDWDVKTVHEALSNGAPAYGSGATIPDPPGSVYDSFWKKMFNGGYDVVKHKIVDEDRILKSLGIPAGHKGGHWYVGHPGYAIWLNWDNTTDEYKAQALHSFPIGVAPNDPAAHPRIRVVVPGGLWQESPQPMIPPAIDTGSSAFDVNVQTPYSDVNVDTSYGGTGTSATSVYVDDGSGPDISPAGLGPDGMIPPPWAAQATYTPSAAYAAQLPAGPVVPFPPPSIPPASQDFIAATNPGAAGAFGDGFAAAIQDDASAVNQPQIEGGFDPNAPPNYDDPNIEDEQLPVCTLPDGTLGVWCDPCNAWTPYYAGVEFGVEPPEGIPMYQDDGSGAAPPPIPVASLPDGTLGVWTPMENGWVNYFPGCEAGAPPPPGVPVY